MNAKLLERIKGLTPEQIYNEVYRDTLTGLLNRKAFEADDAPSYALIDLDSLKYINDTFGHRWGDRSLVSLAALLVLKFGHDCVYRIGGDEFAVKGTTPTLLSRLLDEAAQAQPTFSYGIANSVEKADYYLNYNKQLRTQRGLRAERGERPPWVNADTIGEHYDVRNNRP